jgi:NAD(P)-dependent dehydrogenase (short-subunit alcohol dehydrogenase family)
MRKTWFITGASRGFGALIAEAALGQGDNVVATARDRATVISRLGQPANLLALPLDVTNEAQAREAAASAIARFERIDVLLNNAGFGLLGAVEESSAEEVERVYRTNVFGLLAVTRAVLPHMRRQRRHSAHRGEERIRGAGTRPLARPCRLNRRHERVRTMDPGHYGLFPPCYPPFFLLEHFS